MNSVPIMSYCQKVIFSFLYRLSRYFAILEFRFDTSKRKFVESRVGCYYLWIWHWIYTTPGCIFGMYIVMSIWLYNTTRNEIAGLSYQVNASHLEFFFLLNVCASWNFIKNRTSLQDILNSIVQLNKRYRQLFGGPVHESEKYFLIYFLLECFSLIWKLAPYPEFYVLYIRFSLTAYLTDMAMILYFYLIKSLATRLKSHAKKSERRLYIQYIADLLNLRHKAQKFIWPIYLCRVVEEFTFLAHCVVAFYWTKKYNWLTKLIKRLPRSNVLPLMILSRTIFKMENNILDFLYRKEIVGLIRKPKGRQSTWRLRKVN